MKTVVVSGAGAGIGFAIAKIFKENNYNVYGIDKDIDNIKKLEEIGVMPICCNVSNFSKLKKKLKQIKKVDILINNAAIQIVKSFRETSIEEWNDVINVNLNGYYYYYLTKIIINKMDEGQIINIGSIHSTMPRKNKMSYDVAKAGVLMMTKELALDLGPSIRVNQIDIGATNTPINIIFETDENEKKSSAAKTVLNVMLVPSDIANVVYELTTTTFKYLTGSIITYDAGRSLK